jgi:hypothetical protein
LRILGLGLESIDDRWLLQRLDWKIAEVLLQDLDPSGCRIEAANPRRLQVPFEVGLEETRDLLEIRRLLLGDRPDSRVASGLDLADERAFSIARFLHGFDWPLFAWIHPWNGEIVHQHSIPDSTMLQSNHRCSRHRRPVRHAPLHLRLIAIHPPSRCSAPWFRGHEI